MRFHLQAGIDQRRFGGLLSTRIIMCGQQAAPQPLPAHLYFSVRRRPVPQDLSVTHKVPLHDARLPVLHQQLVNTVQYPYRFLTSRHPSAGRHPRPRPPMTGRTLSDPLALRRTGIPCRVCPMTHDIRSRYTHRIETDVCAESSEPFVPTPFLCQTMRALVIPRPRDRAVFRNPLRAPFAAGTSAGFFLI